MQTRLAETVVLETAWGLSELPNEQLQGALYELTAKPPEALYGLKVIRRDDGVIGSPSEAFRRNGWSQHAFQVVDAAKLIGQFGYAPFEVKVPGTNCWIRGQFIGPPDPELERLLMEEEEIERRRVKLAQIRARKATLERREPF